MLILIQRLSAYLGFMLRQPIQNCLVGGLWLGTFAWLEVFGRQTRSDVTDAFLLCGVVFLAGVTAIVHHQGKVPAVTFVLQLIDRLRQRIAAGGLKYGADLRMTPPLPRRWPARWTLTLLISASGTVAVALMARRLPASFRDLVAGKLYLAYFSGLIAVWGALLGGTVVQIVFAWGCLNDSLRDTANVHPATLRRRKTLAYLTTAQLLIAGGGILPAIVPVVLLLILLGLHSAACALLPPGLVILWRSPRQSAVSSSDGRWWIWMQGFVPMVLSLGLIFFSRGEVLAGATTPSSMILTRFLGLIFAWASIAGACALTWYSVRLLWLGRQFAAIRHDQMPKASNAEEESSLIARRQEIRLRRQLVRGLEKLFKHGRRQKYSQGTGFLIGLQYWFVLGVVRDEEEDSGENASIWDGIIGPPFHQVFQPECRRSFQKMTRDLQVDLLFVEDGITFRRFVRVLRMMFEIHDIFGGRKRIEDWHFAGIPGVRVIIHDFNLEQPVSHQAAGYPEPKYDEIGRARIVHVFKDRGESEVLQPVPSDFAGEPVLSGV